MRNRYFLLIDAIGAAVAVLIALNREHELRLHIGGAMRNGCSLEELVEVAVQCAPYCGLPAAIDAVRSIKAVTDESA